MCWGAVLPGRVQPMLGVHVLGPGFLGRLRRGSGSFPGTAQPGVWDPTPRNPAGPHPGSEGAVWAPGSVVAAVPSAWLWAEASAQLPLLGCLTPGERGRLPTSVPTAASGLQGSVPRVYGGPSLILTLEGSQPC